MKDVPGVVLKFLCIGVDSLRDSFQRLELFCNFYLHRMEETFTIGLKFFQKVFVDFFEGTDVNDISFLVYFVMHLSLVCIVCLSLLLMLVEPFSFNWFIHGFRHILDAVD